MRESGALAGYIDDDGQLLGRPALIITEAPVLEEASNLLPQPPRNPLETGRILSDHVPELSLSGTYQKREIPAITYTPFEKVSFTSLAERSKTVKEVIGQYKNHPRVYELLRYVTVPPILEEPTFNLRGELSDYMTFALRFRLLKREEVSMLFERMERGLATHRGLEGSSPSAEQEANLAELAAAYTVVYNCNLRLVVDRVVKRVRNPADPLIADLIQEGNLGLGNAIRRYDYTKGYTLATYAEDWVNRAVSNGYANLSRTIQIPLHVNDKWTTYQKASYDLTSELGRQPTIEEICKATNLKVNEINQLEVFGRRHLLSLDAPITSDEETVLGDRVPYSDDYHQRGDFRPTPEPIRAKVLEILEDSALSDRRRLLLSLKFGVYLTDLSDMVLSYNGEYFSYEELMEELHSKGGELSHAEIAALMGFKNEESVGDILRKTLATLRVNHPDLSPLQD